MHMSLSISLQIAASVLLLSVIAFDSPVSAESPTFKRPCPIDGRTVDVVVAPIPDIAQRCYEIAYQEQRSYVCVWFEGTPEGPYSFSSSFDAKRVTTDGWTGGGNVRVTAEDAFKGACRSAVQRYEIEKRKLRFDPDKAAQALDEFFKAAPLPESSEVAPQ